MERTEDTPRPTVARRLWPVVVAIAVLVIASAAAATVLIDVHDVGGLRTAFEGSPLEVPYLYYHLYRDGGPLELLQWSSLAALIVTAGIQTGARRGLDPLAVRFWSASAVLAALMLMEDAGNVRHHLADLGVNVLPMADPVARTLVEMAFYLLVATPALIAVWTYRTVGPAHRPPLALAAGGFVAYFLASVASASRALGDWYVAAGTWVQSALLGRLPPMPDGFWDVASGADVTAFMVMDHLFEESVELLGATLLLSAALATTLPAITRRDAPAPRA